MNRKNSTKEECPAMTMFSLLSKRHMLLLLYTLSTGAQGFNELEKCLDINTATLMRRLRELERAELIVRVVLEEDRRNRYYSLSKRGHKVSVLIEHLGKIARTKE